MLGFAFGFLTASLFALAIVLGKPRWRKAKMMRDLDAWLKRERPTADIVIPRLVPSWPRPIFPDDDDVDFGVDVAKNGADKSAVRIATEPQSPRKCACGANTLYGTCVAVTYNDTRHTAECCECKPVVDRAADEPYEFDSTWQTNRKKRASARKRKTPAQASESHARARTNQRRRKSPPKTRGSKR